jgi:integrase
MYLFVSPTGAKSWRYKYRLLGKERTFTIGSYPELSLADARVAHEVARALVAKEIDPGEHRKAATQKKIAAAANTFEAVARDLIAKRSTKGDPEKRWTPGYAAKVTRILERELFPKVGALKITDVGAAELSPILEGVSERKKVKMPHQKKVRTRNRGAATTAIHIRQLCAAIYRHAASKGLARYDYDPTWGLKDVVSKPAVQHNKHLELDELPAFWGALDQVAAGEQVKIAIELLGLTFVRTQELRLAEWAEFDLEGKGKLGPHWRIPAYKMKKRREHLVPLSNRALQLIARLRELTGDTPYLFPNRTRSDGVMNPNTINQTLYRMGYAGKLSGHGFRATASTALNDRGFAPHLVEMQLAHWGGRDKTEASYNHALYWSERVKMMREWADMLASECSNVVPFKKTA